VSEKLPRGSPGSVGVDGEAKHAGGVLTEPLIGLARDSRIWYVAHSTPAAGRLVRRACALHGQRAAGVSVHRDRDHEPDEGAQHDQQETGPAMNAKPSSAPRNRLPEGEGQAGLPLFQRETEGKAPLFQRERAGKAPLFFPKEGER